MYGYDFEGISDLQYIPNSFLKTGLFFWVLLCRSLWLGLEPVAHASRAVGIFTGTCNNDDARCACDMTKRKVGLQSAPCTTRSSLRRGGTLQLCSSLVPEAWSWELRHGTSSCVAR
jgi:hypothetical protein